VFIWPLLSRGGSRQAFLFNSPLTRISRVVTVFLLSTGRGNSTPAGQQGLFRIHWGGAVFNRNSFERLSWGGFTIRRRKSASLGLLEIRTVLKKRRLGHFHAANEGHHGPPYETRRRDAAARKNGPFLALCWLLARLRGFSPWSAAFAPQNRKCAFAASPGALGKPGRGVFEGLG